MGTKLAGACEDAGGERAGAMHDKLVAQAELAGAGGPLKLVPYVCDRSVRRGHEQQVRSAGGLDGGGEHGTPGKLDGLVRVCLVTRAEPNHVYRGALAEVARERAANLARADDGHAQASRPGAHARRHLRALRRGARGVLRRGDALRSCGDGVAPGIYDRRERRRRTSAGGRERHCRASSGRRGTSSRCRRTSTGTLVNASATRPLFEPGSHYLAALGSKMKLSIRRVLPM